MNETKKSNWLTVFLIPIVAFGISAWTVYKFFDERGYIIRVEFKSAEGIEVNKTLLKYHGVPVGKVQEIELSDDLKKVVLVIRLEKKAVGIARKGAQFKIVRPKATIGELENLEAILGGNYIEVELPTHISHNPEKQVFYYYFIGDDGIPEEVHKDDLIIQLKANSAFSATNVGSEIFYKGFPVGVIEDFILPSHGKHIIFTCRVFKNYSHLVRSNSVFWDLPILDLDWKLTKGFQLKTISSPLATALNGGVAFATPNNTGSYVSKYFTFDLNKKFEEEWLDWQPSNTKAKN